ncbi:hypothetical protein [Amycolatopsis australiensis]|uniref:Lipoprotein n=1 Tax=Amycolatopsis australiensis TaxID=546364 RepID=A0A1K1SXE0_9PSEU|nr:hypothetical protein [Amycolatopsis australiensis]SFW89048.1 hypothetical protein SAMN04489730_7137 [Amycolatopsis australiensis]
MNESFVRRARKLSVAGAGAILVGLTMSACSSAPVPAPTPTPSAAPTATASTATAAAPAPTAAAPAADQAGRPVAPHQPVPVLGRPWGPYQHGYGTVRPGLIDNGGDASAVISHVHWRTWGGETATGSGTASFVPDGEPLAAAVPKTATIEAWDLGTCDGKLMYRAVGWFFPGEQLDKHEHIDLCTGEYVKS